MITKRKYKIEKNLYPTDKETHVLWLETETIKGYGYRGVFKGTYQECIKEKEKREGNVQKSNGRSFSLLRKALHDK